MHPRLPNHASCDAIRQGTIFVVVRSSLVQMPSVSRRAECRMVGREPFCNDSFQAEATSSPQTDGGSLRDRQPLVKFFDSSLTGFTLVASQQERRELGGKRTGSLDT